MRGDAVLDLLRGSQALLEGHFELSSGLHSDRYFQCALVLADPLQAERLARALAARLSEEHLTAPPDLVVGPALGAVVWAHEMARALGLHGYFSERKEGRMQLRRGFHIEPGKRVLVVEDVVTTGGSAREVIELLSDLGAEVTGVATVVNRSGGNPFADLGLKLWALAEAEVRSFEPAECPLCAGGGRAVKPGSRPGSGVGA